MTFDTWDPVDSFAAPRVTFSNGNLTATGHSGTTPSYSNTNPAMFMSTEGKLSGSGLWYFEVTIQGGAFNNVGGVGLASCVQNVGSGGVGFGIGFNTSPSGFAYFPSNGTVSNDGSTAGSLTTSYGVGDVVSIALDANNHKVWCRKNNGNWCGTSGPNGVANPATNTQGIDLTASFTAGRVFAAAQFVDTNAAVTANFGATTFAQAVPAGYSGWTKTTSNLFASLWYDFQGNQGQIPAGGVNSEVGPWIVPSAGSITSLVGTPSIARSGTSSRALIYADNGSNTPSALLGSSTILTSLVQGENTYTFGTPVAVTAGQKLWIGFVCDGAGGSYFSANNNNCPTGGAFHSSMVGVSTPDNPFVPSGGAGTTRVPVLVFYTPTPPPPTGGAKGCIAVVIN